MEDPIVIEAWFRLIQAARRGDSGAQEAIRLLAEAWKSPEELRGWMEQFVPLRSELSGPDGFREWMEGWWRMMGVVPRFRYLELLERSETLKARFEEAEATIQHLRTMLGNKEQENRREEILELWETASHKTLKAQDEWLRTWQTSWAKQENPDDTRTGAMEPKPTEQIFPPWAEMQHTMWDDWFKATQGFGRTQTPDVWSKTVEAWEESLQKTLYAQTEWARQGQAMTRRWADAQIRFWEGWFGVVRKLDPSTLGGSWEQESQKVLQIWQEAIRNARDAQVEWGHLWTARHMKRHLLHVQSAVDI
jgi:hypothetical protein